MLDTVINNPWVRALALIAALVALGILVYLLSPVLVPLLFAFLVAYCLDPVVDFFERLKVRRGVTIGAFAGLAIALALATPIVFIPSIVTQAENLSKALESEDWREEGLSSWLYTALNRLPLEDFVESMDWVPVPAEGEEGETGSAPDEAESEGGDETTPEPEQGDAQAEEEAAAPEEEPAEESADDESAEDLEEAGTAAQGEPAPDYDPFVVIMQNLSSMIRENALDFLRSNASGISESGTAAGSTLLGVLQSIGNRFLGFLLAAGNVLLFAFVAGYLLKDYDNIVAAARDLVPHRFRNRVYSIADKIDSQIRGFLRGQLLVCMCLGVMYAIGLSIAAVPFAIPLAMIGAISSFVPYLGLIVLVGPSFILVVIAHQGFDWHFLAVLATFSIAQIVESTVLTPKIVGDQVGLSEVWVILAILVFTNALGFVGLLLAVPIAAALKILVVESVDYYRASEFFKDST